MPVSLSFTEPLVFKIDASGNVTYDECTRILEELVGHPQLRADSRVFVDGRTVTKVPNTQELRALAQALAPLAERGVHQMGILTASAFVYGVARMFSVFAELADVKVSVFKEMDEAERWKSL